MPRGRMQRSLSLPAHDWLPVKKSLSLPPYDWLGECWGPCPAAPIDQEDITEKAPAARWSCYLLPLVCRHMERPGNCHAADSLSRHRQHSYDPFTQSVPA